MMVVEIGLRYPWMSDPDFGLFFGLVVLFAITGCMVFCWKVK